MNSTFVEFYNILLHDTTLLHLKLTIIDSFDILRAVLYFLTQMNFIFHVKVSRQRINESETRLLARLVGAIYIIHEQFAHGSNFWAHSGGTFGGACWGEVRYNGLISRWAGSLMQKIGGYWRQFGLLYRDQLGLLSIV